MLKMRSFWIGLGALALALAAGCGAQAPEAQPEVGDPLEGVTFSPIEAIVEGDIEVTDFADGTARLPVNTTIPVACSVVYGTTPEFGFVALDEDMGSAAHGDHTPVLRNLEGETTYYFRFQGVDENGVLYLSEVMTFTTPAFDEPAGAVDNLASPDRGAEILGFSSAFGDSGIEGRWGVANAFDGNPNTEWSTAGDGDAAWVEVQLAQRARIDTIEFRSRAMGDGSSITLAFTVTTDDGAMFGPFQVPDASGVHSFAVDLETSTLRFDLVDTTGGNTGVVDLAVYGELIGP